MGSLTIAALFLVTDAFAFGFTKDVDVYLDSITEDALSEFSVKGIDLSEAIVITDLDYDVTTVVFTDTASLSSDFASISGSASVTSTSASASFYGSVSGSGYSSVSGSSYAYVGDSGSYASVTGSVESATDSLSIDLSASTFDASSWDSDTTLDTDFDFSTFDLTLDDEISFDVSELEIYFVESGETLDFGDYSVTAE